MPIVLPLFVMSVVLPSASTVETVEPTTRALTARRTVYGEPDQTT